MARFKALVSFILSLLTLGLIILAISQAKTIKNLENLSPPSASPTSLSLPSKSTVSPASSPGSLFSGDTVSSLQASLSGLLNRLEELEQTQAIGGTGPSVPFSNPIVFQPQVIYLGSASTQKHQWTASGIEVSLNTADYPTDVTAVFEAALSIIGGEAWARLTNKTTGAILSVTEVFHNNSTVTWKTSPGFKLHPGLNTYVVELKSSSGETANLSGARLRLSR